MKKKLRFNILVFKAQKLPLQKIRRKPIYGFNSSTQSYYNIKKVYSKCFKNLKKVKKLQNWVRKKVLKPKVIEKIKESKNILHKPFLQCTTLSKKYKCAYHNNHRTIIRAFLLWIKSKPKAKLWDRMPKIRKIEYYTKQVINPIIVQHVDKIVRLLRKFNALRKVIPNLKMKFLKGTYNLRYGNISRDRQIVRKIKAGRFVESALKIQHKFKQWNLLRKKQLEKAEVIKQVPSKNNQGTEVLIPISDKDKKNAVNELKEIKESKGIKDFKDNTAKEPEKEVKGSKNPVIINPKQGVKTDSAADAGLSIKAYGAIAASLFVLYLYYKFLA